ncbi:MAG: hypothetical protein LBH82_05585 [Bacteroidales bacterium]|jgi:signal transduction histidine kinase|nr:hypothetical protein [Bacteroidales bacterium]
MDNIFTTRRKGYFYLATAVIFIVAASIVNGRARLAISGERKHEQFQSNFLLKEKKMDDMLMKLATSPHINTSLELLDFCEKNKINHEDFVFFIYKDSILTAWSSNEIIPPKHWESIFGQVLHVDNIWTYPKQIVNAKRQCVAFLILDNDPDLNKDNTLINNPFANDTTFSLFDGKPYSHYDIYNNAGDAVFTFSIVKTLKKNAPGVLFEMILWLAAYTLLLFTLICFLLQINYFSRHTNLLFLLIAAILTLSSRVTSVFFNFSSDLFSPLYYSSYYDSLGMLFLNAYFILLGSSIFMQFFTVKDFQDLPQKRKIAVMSALIFLSFLQYIFIYMLVTGTTNDSVVVLKPEMIYQYDLFSIIAIASIVFMLWSAFNITYKCLDEAFSLLPKRKLFIIIVLTELLFALLIFSVLYFGILHKSGSGADFPFLIFLLLIVAIIIFITMQKRWHNMLFHCLIYLILSGMALMATGKTADEREEKYKESMAEMMLSIEDPFVFYSFRELADEMYKDTFLVNLFSRDTFSATEIQHYIIPNYIRQYAENYRISINIGLESLWENDAKKKYRRHNPASLYETSVDENVTFRRIGFGRSEYIIDLSIPAEEGNDVGKIMISFFKIYVDSEQQSELGKTLQKEMSNYSYAGYENNILKMNAGNKDVSYFYNFSDYQLDSLYSGMTFAAGNIAHTAYKHNNMVLLVSTAKKIIWDKMSFIIILFLGQFVFSLLPMALNSVFKPHNIWRPGIQESIQYFVIILITLTVIITAFIFVNLYKVLRINDLDSIQNQASARVNRIINTLVAESGAVFELSNDIVEDISEELESVYELDFLDLNLYNKEGENIENYGKGIYIHTHVNPLVFRNLSSNQTGTCIIDEVFNKEKYRSYYRTIINREGKIIGYTNLFSNPAAQEEMVDFRHTQFITKFMMVCVFIIILIVFLSMLLVRKITLPLLKVAERLSNIKLGEEIKKIEWHRDDEFGQLVKNYNLLIDRLDESARILEKSSQEIAWRDMARQVAHEIKNPLTPMRLTTQQMMRQLSSSELMDKKKLSRYFSMVIQQTDTLTDIANSFSNFAKVDQQNGFPEDLIPIIQNTISSFDENEVSFSLRNCTSDEKVISFVNKSQISRVFNNLVKNAIQAKNPKRPLSIVIEIENYGDKMWQISLMDTGIGIPEDIKSKVFSPNFTTKTSGTGLGLAMTRRIINSWDGNISFESTYGVGTIFYITLPKYEEHTE